MTKHSSLQTIRDEHASLAAMLQSMRMMVERGPSDDRRNFFDVVRAMLFYIDEFPERLHHPKESNPGPQVWNLLCYRNTCPRIKLAVPRRIELLSTA